jgi:hypothetical protein
LKQCSLVSTLSWGYQDHWSLWEQALQVHVECGWEAEIKSECRVLMLASKILPYMNTTCSRPVSDDEFLFAKKSRCKFLWTRQSIHTCFCGTLPLRSVRISLFSVIILDNISSKVVSVLYTQFGGSPISCDVCCHGVELLSRPVDVIFLWMICSGGCAVFLKPPFLHWCKCFYWDVHNQ